jgi:hypothetical protein
MRVCAGCSLADFVRWHSPHDFDGKQLSARMSGYALSSDV